MPRRPQESGAMRAIERSSPSKETKRAPRPAEKSKERRPTREEEAAARATAAAEHFDRVAKVISTTQDKSVSSWIAARREQILADTAAAESKDVQQALHRRMELSALAAKMTPDQTLALRAYLDGIDAADASYASMMAEKRQAKKGTSSEAADARTEEWKQAKKNAAALKAEVLAAGIVKLDDYDFGRKATRDAMRGERLSLRDIDPQEMAAIKSYIDMADAVERANARLGQTARALNKLKLEDPAYQTAVKEDDDAYDLYQKLRKNFAKQKMYAAYPELSTKASRERLRQEIPGLERRPLRMDEYDEPTYVPTPSYVQNLADAKSRAAFIARVNNAQDLSPEAAMDWATGRQNDETVGKTAVPESEPAQKTLVTRRPYRENTVTQPGVLPPLPDYGRPEKYLEATAPTETTRDRTDKTERPTLVPLSEDGEDDIVLTEDMMEGETDAFPENPTLVPENPTDIGQVRATAKRVLKQEAAPAKKPSRLGSLLRRGLLALFMTATPHGQEEAPVAREQTMFATLTHDSVAPEGIVTGVAEEMAAVYVPSRAKVKAKRLVRSAEDVGTLENALKIINALPGYRDYKKMRAEEQAAQTKAALEDIAVIRRALGAKHTTANPARRARLDSKLDQAETFWELQEKLKGL